MALDILCLLYGMNYTLNYDPVYLSSIKLITVAHSHISYTVSYHLLYYSWGDLTLIVW